MLKKQIKKIKELDKKYIWHPFTQMQDWEKQDNLIIAKGEGEFLFDIEGKKYIDGVSSLWLNLHGHKKRDIDDAIKKQLKKVAHSTLLGLGNMPSILLAEKLIQIVPDNLKKVFYSDNGSTAVEIALKIAFQFWQNTGKKDKTKFVSLKNAYHGDTIGSVSVGGMDLFHEIYKQLLFYTIKIPSPYCYRCEFKKDISDCDFYCVKISEKIIKKNKNKIAGLIIEPMNQAASGMIIQPTGYLKKIYQICKENDVLFIVDEVATGFGRTGKMFACEHEKIKPDIMTLAKGLSGGYLPIAATVTTEKIFNSFLADYNEKKTFFHGHSYTGNQLAAVAAIASLNIFEKERVLIKLQHKIEFIKKELEKFRDLEIVGDIRQLGFMIGIELVKNKLTKEEFDWGEKIGIRVCSEAKKHGLIIRPLGNVIVMLPPLSISEFNLKKMLNIIYKCIKTISY